MKRRVGMTVGVWRLTAGLVLVALLAGVSLWGQVPTGDDALRNGDVQGALAAYGQALQTDPNDTDAAFMHALTLLLDVFERPPAGLDTALASWDVTWTRDAYAENVTGDALLEEPYTDMNMNGYYDPGEPYTDLNGNGQYDEELVPSDAVGENVVVDAFLTGVMPIVDQAVGDLGVVGQAPVDWTKSIGTDMLPDHEPGYPYDADRTDALLLRGGLQVLQTVVCLIGAYDLDVDHAADKQTIPDRITDAWWDRNSSWWTVRDSSRLTASEGYLREGLVDVVAGLDGLLAGGGAGIVRLGVDSPRDVEKMRGHVNDVLAALDGPHSMDPDSDTFLPWTLALGRLFSNPLDRTDVAWDWQEDQILWDSLDPTLNGMLPDETVGSWQARSIRIEHDFPLTFDMGMTLVWGYERYDWWYMGYVGPNEYEARDKIQRFDIMVGNDPDHMQVYVGLPVTNGWIDHDPMTPVMWPHNWWYQYDTAMNPRYLCWQVRAVFPGDNYAYSDRWDADWDIDGLADWQEIKVAGSTTNPYVAWMNHDMDALGDGDEFARGTPPGTANAESDNLVRNSDFGMGFDQWATRGEGGYPRAGNLDASTPGALLGGASRTWVSQTIAIPDAALSVLLSYRLAARAHPGADMIADAFPIGGAEGWWVFDSSGATEEVGEPQPPPGGLAKSVWWRWTAPHTGTFQFRVTGNSATWMPSAAVYASGDMTWMAGPMREVQFVATGGQSYYVAVYGDATMPAGVATLTWGMPWAAQYWMNDPGPELGNVRVLANGACVADEHRLYQQWYGRLPDDYEAPMPAPGDPYGGFYIDPMMTGDPWCTGWWCNEWVDLDDFAGRNVELRFECLNLPGECPLDFYLTDVRVECLLDRGVGPATGLAFLDGPSEVGVNVPFSPPMRFAFVDDNGYLVNTDGLVSLSFGSNPSSALLSGTTAMHASYGVASFANLQLDKAGAGYVLLAQGGGHQALSDAFSAGAIGKLFDFCPGYALMSVPTADSGITSAAGLLNWLPDGQGVWRWSPVTNTWAGYVTGLGGANFAVVPGDAFLVACSGTQQAGFGGALAAGLSYTLSSGYNFICLPPEREAITSASGLLAAIPNATGVWRWNLTTQAWEGYTTLGGGTNFPVTPGDPVVVAVSQSTTWPQ